MDFSEKSIKVKPAVNVDHFAPVFSPGLIQREEIDDNGLGDSMRYLNNVGVGKDAITLKSLRERFGNQFVNDMSATVLKHTPDATEEEIVMTIMTHCQ